MSEMEKILQNWDTADEYLNSKVEENKLPTYTLEEYERVKDSIPVGTKFIITDDVDGLGDYIPVPQTAEVGQILAVKAVDSEGKPIEWETVDKGGGGSGEGRTVKTYDLVVGTQIPVEKNVYYPCHVFYSSSSTDMYFGECAILTSNTQLRIEFLYVSSFGTLKINSTNWVINGSYDETTGIFTVSSTYTNKKLMI